MIWLLRMNFICFHLIAFAKHMETVKYASSRDAQIIPYVRGVRDNNWRITSVIVDFRHPKVMKEQEEGSSAFTKKRLMQLNLLFDLLGDKELTIGS